MKQPTRRIPALTLGGLIALGAMAGWVIYRDLSRRGWGTVAE